MITPYIKGKTTVTHKEAKFLLAKFLMENNVLKSFILCYKHHSKNYRFKNYNHMTPNMVLYDCINNLEPLCISFSELFNFSDASFSWFDTPAKCDVDWYVIHTRWESLTRKIDIQKNKFGI